MNMEKPTTKRITFDEMPNVIAQLSVYILEMSNALHILMEEVEGLREHIMAKPVSARRIPVSFERACEITGKAKNTMYRYTSQGLIPHYKRGKTVYFIEDELLEWVRNSRIETLLERQDSQDRNILSIQAKSKTIK